MKNVKDVAIIVQARLSSQRCHMKMVKPFADTTLMDLCLEKLCKSKIPNDKIWVSIYEPKLKAICNKYPVNIFSRSKKSALSEGTPMTEMYEWWDKIDEKYAVLVNACAPFLSKEIIEQFYFDYCNSDKDGMFGVIEKRNYFWDKNNVFLTPLKESVMNTKTAEIIKEAAHCLYAGKLSLIGKGLWMGDFNKHEDIKLFSVPEKECFDIDYEWQFNMAETIYKNVTNFK